LIACEAFCGGRRDTGGLSDAAKPGNAIASDREVRRVQRVSVSANPTRPTRTFRAMTVQLEFAGRPVGSRSRQALLEGVSRGYAPPAISRPAREGRCRDAPRCSNQFIDLQHGRDFEASGGGRPLQSVADHLRSRTVVRPPSEVRLRKRQ
jgi:hypothetical protein